MPNLFDQLAIASPVRAVADIAPVGQRPWWDASGLGGGFSLFLMSLYLTGKMGGPRL